MSSNHTELIDCDFIKQYDPFITYCVKKYTCKAVDDIKQDIYLILCQHAFRRDNVKAYISTIVRNYFYSIYRRQKLILRENYTHPVTNSSELHLYLKDVLHSIDELPNGECLKLYSNGFKYREIAEKLHLSMSNVKSSIYRIRHRLKWQEDPKLI